MSGVVVFGIAVAVLAALAFPFSWRRAGHRWTAYAIGTGSPVVVVQLGVGGLLSAVAGAMDPAKGHSVLSAVLLVAVVTQWVLLRQETQREESQREDGERRERREGRDGVPR